LPENIATTTTPTSAPTDNTGQAESGVGSPTTTNVGAESIGAATSTPEQMGPPAPEPPLIPAADSAETPSTAITDTITSPDSPILQIFPEII